MTELFSKMIRVKDLNSGVLNTNLRRCLTTLDIALLGVGNMLGSGIYVVSPEVARKLTGPAIVISYLIAGVTSLFAALAYAEFGVRYPRAGSAYSYTYLSVGELLAFFVGWNVIMENILSLAVVARACSEYTDSLVGGAISNFTISILGTLEPGSEGFIGHYPNVLAALILLVFFAFMTLGAKETSWLNNLLVVVNIGVVSVILGVGAYFADISNWEYHAERKDPQPDGFINGFLPFGWTGVLSASAQCFFAYVGFDGIAAAGEEARDPKKSIPAATLITMTIVSLVYISVSAVLTLMMPYYEIKASSGIPDALGHHKVPWARAIVSIGALICMATAIIGTIYAVSRVIYAMAEDGLMPAALQKTLRKVPVFSMLLCTLFAVVIAVVFNINAIIEMLSIGTLFAYLLVAFAVLVVRHTSTAENDVLREKPNIALKPWAQKLRIFYPECLNQRKLVISVMTLDTALCFGVGFTINARHPTMIHYAAAAVMGFLILFSVLYLSALEEVEKDDKYKMPFAPFLPILSVFCNVFLMTTLGAAAWERLTGWMVLGILLYLVHGIRHSKLNRDLLEQFDHSTAE